MRIAFAAGTRDAAWDYSPEGGNRADGHMSRSSRKSVLPENAMVGKPLLGGFDQTWAFSIRNSA
jgi:hypothetical protein